MTQSLADLTASAVAAVEPSFITAVVPRLGGVDPLGLRQINFDLMDQVLPGLNNVARHVRPFVVVTWAWRRAQQRAETLGMVQIKVDDLRDFVDRIEVIYAWSQFLRNPDVDLPGRRVFSPFMQVDQYTFGGNVWRKFRKSRRDSTSFSAPITYGPSLKTLRWLERHRDDAAVLIPSPASRDALDAFEKLIKGRLAHPVFNQFGKVTVTKREVKKWAEAWALENLTEPEKRIMGELLVGSPTRKKGCELMFAAVAQAGKKADVARIRWTMAGPPSKLVPRKELADTFEAWRRIQVRQLFRLSLEALLYWIMWQLEDRALSTDALIAAFFIQVGRRKSKTARDWLSAAAISGLSPTTLMDRIGQTMDEDSDADLASAVADSLAFCIAEAPEHPQAFERADRLPLYRARREAEAWSNAPARSFVRHIFESWVMAQHVYWSVGRGLADARAQGKTILRLKLVLEEAGWTLAPGTSRARPVPTRDRLETALSLANECGFIDFQR